SVAAHHIEDAPAQALGIRRRADQRYRARPQQGAEIRHSSVPRLRFWKAGFASEGCHCRPAITCRPMKAPANFRRNTRPQKGSVAQMRFESRCDRTHERSIRSQEERRFSRSAPAFAPCFSPRGVSCGNRGGAVEVSTELYSFLGACAATSGGST